MSSTKLQIKFSLLGSVMNINTQNVQTTKISLAALALGIPQWAEKSGKEIAKL
jgi:hypothetical protein